MRRSRSYPSIFLVLLLASLLGGCFQAMHVKCKGKGKLTFLAAMYGGTIEGDCGDGFEYERSSEKFPVPAPPK